MVQVYFVFVIKTKLFSGNTTQVLDIVQLIDVTINELMVLIRNVDKQFTFLLEKRVDIGKKALGHFTAEDLARMRGRKNIKNLFNPPKRT